jgi:beta-lactamase class A
MKKSNKNERSERNEKEMKPTNRGLLPMKISMLILLTSLTLASGTCWAELEHRGGSAGLTSLRAEISRLAETSGGLMGVAVIHLETGTSVSIHGDESFPMASAYKVPIAVTLLKQVDAGEKQLSNRVEVTVKDMVPSMGITTHFIHPGVVLSLHNLLDSMLIVSDNTATDVLMEQVGGAQHINQTLRSLNIDGIQLNRNTAELIRDFFGRDNPPPGEKRSLLKMIDGMSAEQQAALENHRSETFADDPRDIATPDAMAGLLKQIWLGNLLSDDSTAIIKDVMLRCYTGKDRLKGLLPTGTAVAHKTGTIGGTSNDVGVITLPHNKGHLVIAAFIKKSELSYEQRDRAIAEVARAAHDYFVFNILQN